MNQNPYAPPRANVDLPPLQATPDAPALGKKLYTKEHIGVAAFLGAALAAGWLFAANYKALGDQRAAKMSWIWGIAATVATMVLAFFLPEKFPNYVIPVGIAFGARALADIRFGAILKNHLAAGGELASWWRVVGISVLCLVNLMAVLFVGVMLLAKFGLIEL